MIDEDDSTPDGGDAGRHGSDGPPGAGGRKEREPHSDIEHGHRHTATGRVSLKAGGEKAAPREGRRGGRGGNPPAALGIGSLAVLATFGLIWLFSRYFSVTLVGVGLTLLGMMWYTLMRRRSGSDGIIFYSHNQIMYYWPIWLGAFVMSDLTGIFGQDAEVMIRGVEESIRVSTTPSMGLFFLIIIALVIFFTSVNIRGVWAVVLGVTVVASGLVFSVFDWWKHILEYLGDLTLYVNRDFYSALGIVLFIPWFAVVFLFDMRRYFHFMPTQIKMVNEIGEGEKSFDSLGVVMEKQRDNFVQHMALGFGSGDLIITTSGGQRDIITFPNVLRIDSVLDEVQEIRERRGRDLM